MNGDGGRISRRRVDRGVVALDPTGGRRRQGTAVPPGNAVMTAGTNKRTADVMTASTGPFIFGIVRGSRLGRVTDPVVVVVDGRIRGSGTIGTAIFTPCALGVSIATAL